ncbi:uncharacterized protein [Ptychodera flava]|uniref:uncharacterized protein n=1 Tax=Ptychodera flava TaxID=63121 RepID=UPI003969FEFE
MIILYGTSGTKKVVNKAELEFPAKLKEARQNEKLKGPRERKATARKLAYDESEAAKSPVKAASKHSPNRKGVIKERSQTRTDSQKNKNNKSIQEESQEVHKEKSAKSKKEKQQIKEARIKTEKAHKYTNRSYLLMTMKASQSNRFPLCVYHQFQLLLFLLQ